jgi:hypothetical protein
MSLQRSFQGYHFFIIVCSGPDRPIKISVSDPDPYWIRIQSGQWIRIRIRNPDPDPGGQKLPTKVEKMF